MLVYWDCMSRQSALIIGLALLALAACGEKKTPGGGATASVEDATAAELERFQAEENARSRVTLVDAASGDAAAMPADWSGPTAFDLRPQGDEERHADTKKPDTGKKPAEATQPAATEEFPSVAE